MEGKTVVSCIIPCLSLDDPKLHDLISSIKAQDFPQDEIEIITVTEGDSEEAKAIGIRKAQGEICAMFCADNMLVDKDTFQCMKELFDKYPMLTGAYSKHYAYFASDNSLNRYFYLIGANDPIAYHLGRADRLPCSRHDANEIETHFAFVTDPPSLGDNGFFFKREHLIQANLDHYYPMDICEDLRRIGFNLYARLNFPYLWHRTTNGNLFTYLKRRYRYARDLYSDRSDRRWNILGKKDACWKLSGFIAATCTVIPQVLVSVREAIRTRDGAWLWHWPVSVGFLATYFCLTVRNCLKHLLSSPATKEMTA